MYWGTYKQLITVGWKAISSLDETSFYFFPFIWYSLGISQLQAGNFFVLNSKYETLNLQLEGQSQLVG